MSISTEGLEPRPIDESTKWMLRDFVQQILHGDDDHQAWLLKAVEQYIAGKRVLQQDELPEEWQACVCTYLCKCNET